MIRALRWFPDACHPVPIPRRPPVESTNKFPFSSTFIPSEDPLRGGPCCFPKTLPFVRLPSAPASNTQISLSFESSTYSFLPLGEKANPFGWFISLFNSRSDPSLSSSTKIPWNWSSCVSPLGKSSEGSVK